MPRVTIESLVSEPTRHRIGQIDGLRFCAARSCGVAYYASDSGRTIAKSDVRVRIGLKETEAPRSVCYCFDHTAEEIEAEVAATGTSRIADDILAKCRQGLDRCQETNPQGSCCLGNVRTVVKEAMARVSAEPAGSVVSSASTANPDCCADGEPEAAMAGRPVKPIDGRWSTAGAVLAAALSSACCWLPLLLIASGASAAGVAGVFETYRPVLLVVAAALLTTGFYFVYLRKPDCTPGEECAVPSMRVLRINRLGLWIAAVFVVGFALFPNYLTALRGGFGGGDEITDGTSGEMMIEIDGMTCAACATTVRSELERVDGVRRATVGYDARQAAVAIEPGAGVTGDALSRAVERAGFKASTPLDGAGTHEPR